jgi:diguanylate cyclase (GGDEF)-like protein
MLEENRLECSEDMKEDTQELTDMTRILSRIIEKRDEQFDEKLHIDALTGVYNKSYGEKLMMRAMEREKGCFMLFDLDHFRLVNGNSGFVIGDVFLTVTAKCIQNMRKDIIISRFGADEFAVLLKNTINENEVRLLMDGFMESIHREVGERKELEGLSVSVGIVFYKERRDTFADVMERADKALYFAKQQGGGTYYFHGDSDKDGRDRSLAKVDLKQIVDFVKNPNSEENNNIQSIYPDLHRMLGFVKKVAEKYSNQIQILMFTVLPNEGEKVSVEEHERVMGILERAIMVSVRDEDMTAKYSSTQRIVILVNREEAQVEEATNRIMKEFYKMYDKKEISVYYDAVDLT